MNIILAKALDAVPRPILSLNRLHIGRKMLIHRLEWQGLVFVCVSSTPILIT